MNARDISPASEPSYTAQQEWEHAHLGDFVTEKAAELMSTGAGVAEFWQELDLTVEDDAKINESIAQFCDLHTIITAQHLRYTLEHFAERIIAKRYRAGEYGQPWVRT